MMNSFKDDILKKIKQEFILSDGNIHKRYFHTIGVVEMALELNKIHGFNLDEKKIILASAFHDIAKLLDRNVQFQILTKYYPNLVDDVKDYPQVWHSLVGAIYAKSKYGIDDEEVLNAIKYHTTGRPDMKKLEALIFVSDYVEEITRVDDKMKKARKIVKSDFDKGLIRTIEDTISYLKKGNKKIYHLTDETYEYYLSKGKSDV